MIMTQPVYCSSPRFSYLVLLVFLSFALTASAQKQTEQPITLSAEQAIKEGRTLVSKILAQRPAENSTNTGTMINLIDGRRTRVPVRFTISVTPANWLSVYETLPTNNSASFKLEVTHLPDTNRYSLTMRQPGKSDWTKDKSDVVETMPFGGSCFSCGDLGLEFLHWPNQRVVKKEMRRSMFCNVLESINPKPVPGAYSRVVSWIDTDSGGIVFAQAYDAAGKLLKEFAPKKVRKIEGQWELQEMEIDNVQTDSRTIIDFDLDGQ